MIRKKTDQPGSTLGYGGSVETDGAAGCVCGRGSAPLCSEADCPVVLYPPVPEGKDRLSILGTVVDAETPEQMPILRTSTALMSPYYMLLNKVVAWCESKGLQEEKGALDERQKVLDPILERVRNK